MIEFKTNKANYWHIYQHLSLCDEYFTPALSTKVNIFDYATKISQHTITFEAWTSKQLIGLVAVYLNQLPAGFITNVSLLNHYQKKGIARQLLEQCNKHAVINGFSELQLEVEANNISAIKLYAENGFIKENLHENIIKMKAILSTRELYE